MLIEEIKHLIPDYLIHCRTIDARYKLITKLGEGRYGKVYLCFDLQFENLVAMKTLRKSNMETNLKNFFNEVLTLTRISSFDSTLKTPKIIDFNLNGTDEFGDIVVFYIMEYIALGELYSVLEPTEFVSEHLACFFFHQLCDNLLILHSHNLLHLDLKPENVLVDISGNLYLCDFGNSVFVDRDEIEEIPNSSHSKILGNQKDSQLTSELLKSSIDSDKNKRNQIKNQKVIKIQSLNTKNIWTNFSLKEFDCFLKNTKFVVTSEYAAPEIAEFESIQELSSKKKHANITLDPPNPSKLDVFSLGVLLFYMIMKSRPFETASSHDEYYKRFLTNKDAFWKIFAKIRNVSKEFKEIMTATLDISNKNRIDLIGLVSHSWVMRSFPTDESYFKVYNEINHFKRLSENSPTNACAKNTSDEPFNFTSSKIECDYTHEGKTGGLNVKHSGIDGSHMIHELHEILTARRVQILEQIKEDLIRKEQKQKSKRFKFHHPFKSSHQNFINNFLQKNQTKLATLKAYLLNDCNQESIESLFSSCSENSSVSGDGK